MSETSASLLDRVKQQHDSASWQCLVDLYSPLIHGWLKRQGVLEQDVNDLVQEVFVVVVRRLPEFQRGAQVGSFRCWLRTITVNCLRDFWRKKKSQPKATGDSNFLEMLHALDDPNSGLSRLWDQEHDQYVTRHLLALIRPKFEAKTWEAFERTAIQGHSADEVAADLGISVNAVFIAKSRVLSRLRQEAAGLLD